MASEFYQSSSCAHLALFHFQGDIELPQKSKYTNSCGIPTFFSSGLVAQREIM
jgi:hypothetical protein